MPEPPAPPAGPTVLDGVAIRVDEVAVVHDEAPE
jgi:hypothetical protein